MTPAVIQRMDALQTVVALRLATPGGRRRRRRARALRRFCRTKFAEVEKPVYYLTQTLKNVAGWVP